MKITLCYWYKFVSSSHYIRWHGSYMYGTELCPSVCMCICHTGFGFLDHIFANMCAGIVKIWCPAWLPYILGLDGHCWDLLIYFMYLDVIILSTCIVYRSHSKSKWNKMYFDAKFCMLKVTVKLFGIWLISKCQTTKFMIVPVLNQCIINWKCVELCMTVHIIIELNGKYWFLTLILVLWYLKIFYWPSIITWAQISRLSHMFLQRVIVYIVQSYTYTMVTYIDVH